MEVVVRSGRWRGRRLDVGACELTVGSDPKSDLVLDDPEVARFQARLYADGDDVRVENFGAAQTALLDGHPLPPGEPTPLPPGSRLEIGDCVLERDGPARDDPLRLRESASAGPHTTTDARRLVLGEIVEAILRLGDRQAFLEKAVDAVFRTLNVRRAFILIVGPDTSTPRRAASRNLEADQPDGYVDVSGTILERTLRHGRAQLLTNAMASSELQDAESVFDFSIKSVLCVPIVLRGKPEGLIYADNRLREASFTEEDLEYLQTLGRFAGVILDHLDRRERQERRIQELEARLRDGVEFRCTGRAMDLVLERVKRFATVEGTVLVTGESGTGKELVARTLHNLSLRRDRPFVAVNCAAVPETLLETELFGHEKGAFTDARQRRPGKFEMAQGGTLFLDEVGEMSPPMQAKLLRVLEGHPFERVGGNEPLDVDVRVIAATNRDLDEAVEAREFRRDLLYRIRVLNVELLPLRQRREEILPLARYFLMLSTDRALRLSREAGEALERHRWPGNVRELRNAIDRAAVMCVHRTIRVEDLPPEIAADPGRETFVEPLSEAVRGHVLRAVASTGGNIARAAKLLGVSRNTVYRHLRATDPDADASSPGGALQE